MTLGASQDTTGGAKQTTCPTALISVITDADSITQQLPTHTGEARLSSVHKADTVSRDNTLPITSAILHLMTTKVNICKTSR